MTHWISPHYTEDSINLNEANIEQRIAIFEDRLRGYFTIPARLVDKIYPNAMVLVLLAIFTCVESLEIFFRGESSMYRSREFFVAGFHRLFQIRPAEPGSPENSDEHIDAALNEIYYRVRSGLIHTGMTRTRVELDKNLPLTVAVRMTEDGVSVERIIINPTRSLNALETAISEYCTQLRDANNTELRANFERAWQILCDESEPDEL